MNAEIKAQLAPHGMLRAAINMSNFLLVTGRTASGDPEGVSPSMAAPSPNASACRSNMCRSPSPANSPTRPATTCGTSG